VRHTRTAVCRLLPALSIGARGHGQQHRTAHHRTGGHRDWTQALSGQLLGGRPHVQTLFAQSVGKLHHQDAVFGDQSDQGDPSNLARNVQGIAAALTLTTLFAVRQTPVIGAALPLQHPGWPIRPHARYPDRRCGHAPSATRSGDPPG